MSTIKINVIFNEESKIIECDDTDTIIIFKNKIIEEFKLITKYIDLEFLNERPIRCLGKFNLEKGLLPRTFDNYQLNRWELVNKEISCTFTQIYDYKPIIKKSYIKNNNNLYQSPNKIKNIESGESYIKKEPEYNLYSNDDFPKLN